MPTTNLNWVDSLLGRIYGSGGKQTYQSGSEVDVESGASFKLAGTPVTASAAELNTLDTTATTWPALLPSAPTFTIGAEGGNVINVAVQLNDVQSSAIAASKVVYAYLSDDSGGDGLAGTAPDGGWAIGTDGTIIEELTANKSAYFWTESDGQFDVDITESGADTWYLCVVIGTNLYVSDAITFS